MAGVEPAPCEIFTALPLSYMGSSLCHHMIRKHEWIEYLQWLEACPLRPDTVCYDNKVLYTLDPTDGKSITKLNIETNEYCTIKAIGDGTTKLLIIHDDIHLFGGDSNSHSVLRQNQTEPIKLCDYGDTGKSMYNHDSIYSEQNKMIYTFGGSDEEEGTLDTDTMYSYDLKTENHEVLDLKIPDGGWELFGCIMTNDERYIIIFGGIENSNVSDGIYIFDMMEMSVRKSNIKCPQPGTYYAISMDDNTRSNIIVTGYIRLIIKQFASDDVMSLMTQWFAEEMVYLIERGSQARLWRMPF